jgi:hypothetical protein
MWPGSAVPGARGALSRGSSGLAPGPGSHGSAVGAGRRSSGGRISSRPALPDRGRGPPTARACTPPSALGVGRVSPPWLAGRTAEAIGGGPAASRPLGPGVPGTARRVAAPSRPGPRPGCAGRPPPSRGPTTGRRGAWGRWAPGKRSRVGPRAKCGQGRGPRGGGRARRLGSRAHAPMLGARGRASSGARPGCSPPAGWRAARGSGGRGPPARR